MRTTFLWIFAFVVALFGFCNKSNAGPCDPYGYCTDQAAWDAAMAGYNIGPYTGVVTITTTVTTIETPYELPSGYPNPDPGCQSLCVIGTDVTTYSQVGLNDLTGDFTFVLCDAFGVCSNDTDITVHFGTPIMGLAADDESCFEDPNLITNAYPESESPRFCDAFPFGTGFLGLVGPISALDFNVEDSFTDDVMRLDLSNIVVATVPEPFTVSVFGMAIAGLAFMRRRSRVAVRSPRVRARPND